MTGWLLERPVGTVAERHVAEVDIVGRRVHVHEVDRPTLVVGSGQRRVPDPQVLAAAGVGLVRRRSGGGGVLLRPGEVLWVDVLLPRGDDLWEDDVGRSAWWLGEAWVGALTVRGMEANVHRGAMVATEWSAAACFAGTGPGEVQVGGRKLVGISQRRTRAGARFQCAVPLSWAPAPLVELLGLEPRERALEDLTAAAVGLRELDAEPDAAEALLTALLDALPA